MRAKTILFHFAGSDRGGTATAFMALASALEKSGYTVKVLLPYEEDLVKCAIDQRYIAGYAMKRRVKWRPLIRLLNLINWTTNWFFYFLLAPKIEHDIFVVYQGGGNSYWWRYTKKPRFAWFHGVVETTKATDLRGRYWEKIFRKNFAMFTNLFAITQQVSDTWTQRYLLLQKPLVIGNLIQIEDIIARAEEPQTEILPATRPQIICVARLSAEKGIDRLLTVAQRLREDGAEFDLWLVGDGDRRIACEAFITESRLSDCVHLLGMKENPYPYIKACDLLVCPSYEEGLGLVLWEALLLQKPVMATECGGTITALQEGRWGRLVENSADGIYKGLKSYLENPSVGQPQVAYSEIKIDLEHSNEETFVMLKKTLGDAESAFSLPPPPNCS